ncbi:MAG: restriction endonuclease subunit S [Synechococcaceae cyanobacterium]|jgi:type I restriction enzyme S subunit
MAELKPGWQRVMFGDVAECINDRVDNPAEAGVDRYVGLEHLDPESLKIRRWGSPDDVESTKLRFRPGDIIFGKRRAYQRKLAVADFQGICSAHAMVLRAKPEVALPEFLPFLMQSDFFMERAVEISVGSLSPTINWKTLAHQEFALPPLEEQKEIAHAFCLSQTLSDSLLIAQQALDKVVLASSFEMLARPIGLGSNDLDIRNAKATPGWTIATAESMLKDGILLALQDGNHGAQYPRADELCEAGYPYIAASDISADGIIDLSSARCINPERASRLRIPPAQCGDVILSHNATVGRVARLPAWDTPIVASTSTTYYRCNEDRLDPEYLRWFMESDVFQFQLQMVMRQSTRNQVPITMQKRLLFAWPSIGVQKELAATRISLRKAREQIQYRRARSFSLVRFVQE